MPIQTFAENRAEVVRTGAARGDRADDQQFIELFDIRKLGHGWHCVIAALEDLGQIQLGDTASGFLRVVIAFGVDDQALEHLGHLGFHLDPKLVHFAVHYVG